MEFKSAWSRDRALLLGGLLLLTGLLWIYMVREARAGLVDGVCRCLGTPLSGDPGRPWGLVELGLLFFMWTEMMAAMMIPTVAPAILLFAALHRKRAPDKVPFLPTTTFLSGYLLVWAGFSLAATFFQWFLHAEAVLSPQWAITGGLLGGAVLVAAGAFQVTSFKRTCLRQCRSPLNFFMAHWQEGAAGAFSMGLRHGVYCLGCCWVLMAILFVVGVMNLFWIALLTMFVLIEKTARRPQLWSRLAGVLLMAWGSFLILRTVSP